MEHLTHWVKLLVTASGSANQIWFIGCALLVLVWCVGLRMALPPNPSLEQAPSNPVAFGLVVTTFVLLTGALAFFAYDLYMAAHVH